MIVIRLPFLVFVFAFGLFLTQVASAADERPTEGRDRLVRVNISPASLNFGSVQSGRYVTRSEQLANNGDITIFIYSAAVDGAAFDFNCPNLPLALKPHSTLSCNVGFRPQFVGKYTGKITVWFKPSDSNDWDGGRTDERTIAAPFHRREQRYWGTKTIHIAAVAAPPAGTISLSSPSIGFGPVEVSQSKSVAETLENSGQEVLTISNIVPIGAGFSFRGINPPLTLSPGQSVRFAVNYAPTSSGVSRGGLAIESNASNPKVSLILAGTAFVPGQLRVSSRAINFENVPVGSTKQQVETLFAVGGPITISSATINNAEFAIGGISLPMTIPSGGTASLILTFRPQSPGNTTGALTLVSTAINSNTAVPIAGTSTAGAKHSVTLSWDPSTSEDVIGYNIYRGTQSGGPYTQINSAPDSAAVATDDHVFAGKTYYYVVTAVTSDSQESAYSNQGSIVIPSP